MDDPRERPEDDNMEVEEEEDEGLEVEVQEVEEAMLESLDDIEEPLMVVTEPIETTRVYNSNETIEGNHVSVAVSNHTNWATVERAGPLPIYFGYRTFSEEYTVKMISTLPGSNRRDLEKGGKVILPPSALEQLTRYSSSLLTPMFFSVKNMSRVNSKLTHCGVLEFTANEGICYMPLWMMKNVDCSEGHIIRLEKAILPTASFSKFQPKTKDFLDVTNPKAILEHALRDLACLTAGDLISIWYNGKTFELSVLETRPAQAVNIIECDMDVDFAPPEDYVSPSTSRQERIESRTNSEAETFKAFSGQGFRLNGKEIKHDLENDQNSKVPRGIPDHNFSVGKIQFFRDVSLPLPRKQEESKKFVPFEGQGRTIRSSRPSKQSNPH